MRAFVLLALMVAANAGAWAVGRLPTRRAAAPLDAGLVLRDGRRPLGEHKTWRGLVAGLACCAAAGHLLSVGAALGAAFGMLSLLGDAASSFVKRRLAAPPGTERPGLDQLPEALLPAIALAQPLGVGAAEIAAAAAAFATLDLATARLRRRPAERARPGTPDAARAPAEDDGAPGTGT